MFDPLDDEGPETQFDVVDRYGESADSEPGDVGPDVPEPPDPTDPDVDVDADLLVGFWRLVVLFNVALLASSVGLMFVAFEGDVEFGGKLLVAGLLVFAYGLYRYRRVRSEVVEPAVAADSDDVAGSTDSDPGGDEADQNG